jgi:hypothetical protein
MLLTLKRRVRRVRQSGENGAALVIAIAAVAVLAIVTASVTAASISATGFTSSSRALNQSQAAADTAIDNAWLGLSGGTFYCTVPPLSGYSYTATIDYFDKEENALSCTGTSTLSGVPAKAVVTSTGRAQAKGVAGVSNGDEFTRFATFDIVIVDNSYELNKAVFTDGGTTLTNSTDLVGTNADFYSNGAVKCQSNSDIKGSVFAQAGITFENSCTISGTVWTATDYVSSSQVSVGGDVYTMGGAALSNQAFVNGTIVANGNISISGNQQACTTGGINAKVCGSVVSLGGSVTLDGNSLIAGGLYAKGAVALGSVNGNKVVGSNLVSTTGPVSATNISKDKTIVGGWVATGGQLSLSGNQTVSWVGNRASTCASSSSGAPETYSSCTPAGIPPTIPVSAIPPRLNYPTNSTVVAPPRESLPRIDMESSTLAARWPGWTVANADCTNYETKITDQTANSKLLLVVDCADGIKWNGKTVTLKGDLAIMSPNGFLIENQFTVKSATAGTAHDFMTIVPSDTPGVTWTSPIATDPEYSKPTCNPTNTGGISIGNNVSSTDTRWFIYTPCTANLNNHWDGFTGQVYAGTLSSLPNGATMTMTAINVPGVTKATAVGSSITVTQESRFDKRG